eukprot:GABU01003847.1.p1 GENE.GABU01003847.1~~GABU01003847.1.p1  ORF type:complete len:166 (-),score=45.69 GABU01003847.1:44-493(-)
MGGGMGMGMGGGMGMGAPGMGMGAPGMGMGMGYGTSGMMQPYGYRQQNWGGYQMATYNIPQMWIEQNSQMVFMTFDRNQSGTLDMMEVPQVINYVFQQLGIGMANPQDVYFAMYRFDANMDGRLNFMEFKRMLYFFSGQGRFQAAVSAG